MRAEAPVAILGATSQIARDFLLTAHQRYGLDFVLFARRPDAVAEFVAQHRLPGRWRIASLLDFARETKGTEADYSGVINFVGVGDPAKARDMGASIFDATLLSDEMATRLVGRRPDIPYIFLSSGAVYGSDFTTPASAATPALVPINQFTPQNYYSVAKLYAEARHRALQGTIIDIRVFNYISRSIDLTASFLITDMIKAVKNGAVFRTTSQALMRDYLHPEDFAALAIGCLRAPPGTNMSLDCYTRAPINKTELIELFGREFGMRSEIVPALGNVNATGSKPLYYSQYRVAERLGYEPRYTSAEGIVIEVRAILAGS